MSRVLKVGAAQLGPNARSDSRAEVVARMIALLEQAAARSVDFVVFPELALTTFFPRWFIESEEELDRYYERAMPNPAVELLFERAKELGLGFSFGFAELAFDDAGEKRRFNTSVVVSRAGEVVGKYRKVHLPGHSEHEPWRPFQHLEKRYFESGDLGFPTFRALGGILGMCICNDRRWPESFRVLGLGGAELVTVGYNTPAHYPPAPEHDHLQDFHNHLSLQAGAYQNGCWVIGVAKAGLEEGCDLIGGSCIVAPTGELVAVAEGRRDELVVADCDLDRCDEIKRNIFAFEKHRQPGSYGPITNQRGARGPA
jgi:N-carbamoyl-D-amino-acid hydrolase